MFRWLLRISLGAFLIGSAYLIYAQAYFFFPYYYETARETPAERERPLPDGYQRDLIGPEGKKIEAWIVRPKTPPKGVAVAFRGNGSPLDSHIALSQLAADYGFAGVVFNYPGMGMSDGTPTEKSIVEAGEAVIRFYRSRPEFTFGKLWIIGYSIGTGPAAILAKEVSPELLMLFAPYGDLRDIVRTRPLFRFYALFSHFAFPTLDAVRSLQTTDFIVATGGEDRTIPNEISEPVYLAYRGRGRKFRIHNPAGRHDMLLGMNRPAIDAALHELGY